MIRLFVVVILLAALVSPVLAQSVAQRTDFVPLAPVRLVKPNGVVRPFGLGATNGLLRGAALLAARDAAAVGDTVCADSIGVYIISSDYQKNGVTFRFAPGVTLANTLNLPVAGPATFPAPVIVNWNRQAYVSQPGNPFLIWRKDFSTSYDLYETLKNYVGVGGGAAGVATIANGRLTYTGATDNSSTLYTLMAQRFIPNSQLVAELRIEEMPAAGVTKNDVIVGFTVPNTPTGSTAYAPFRATFRRLAATPNGQFRLDYVRNDQQIGDTITTGTLATPISFPFTMKLWMNQNSLAVVVEEGGREYIVLNLEVIKTDWDLEKKSTIELLRPYIAFENDNQGKATVSHWEVRAPGALGLREHYMAHYENGEPLRNQDGYYYLTVDQCGPTTLSSSLQDSYNRTVNGAWLYDAQNKRMVGPTAQYVSQYAYGGDIYRAGMIEAQVIYDRRTQLFHLYHSNWRVEDKGGASYVEHYATRENILNGYRVFTNMQRLDTTALGPDFESTDSFYDNDFIYNEADGFWYWCGTVRKDGTNPSGVSARVFLVRGTSPTTFTTVRWIRTDRFNEGARFWRVGGTYYVSSGAPSGNIDVFELADGTLVQQIDANMGGDFPAHPQLVPVIADGKTEYQLVTFSAYANDGYFRSDFNGVSQTGAWGPTAVGTFGTFAGEEFTSLPFDQLPDFGSTPEVHLAPDAESSIRDTAFAANWDGNGEPPTKNAVYDKIAGDMLAIPFNSGLAETTLADGETIFFGAPYSNFPPSASPSDTLRRIYLPAGRIVGVKGLGFPANAGVSSENTTIYVRINNTTDVTVTTTFQFSATAYAPTVFTNTTLNTAVALGDYAEVKVVAPTYATNPTGVQFQGVIYVSPTN